MGLTGSCGATLDETRRNQVSLSGGGLRTDLVFDGARQHLEEASIAAAFTYRPSTVSFQVSLGALLGGSLDGELGNYRLQPGVVSSVSVGLTMLDGTGPRPYLAFTAALGVATAQTHSTSDPADRPRFTALDLRAAVVLGKQLFGFWLPYVGAATFGGPVWFSAAGQPHTGSDRYHYRLSAGSSFRLPAHLEAFVEVGFLGEQNLLGGLGWSF